MKKDQSGNSLSSLEYGQKNDHLPNLHCSGKRRRTGRREGLGGTETITNLLSMGGRKMNQQKQKRKGEGEREYSP